jgi:glutamine cyclotransferase
MFQTTFLHCLNSKADKSSLCITNATLFSFGGIGWSTRASQATMVLTGSNSYAFRSPEKVALQEIGPRFTLKLRSLKKNIPAV